MMARVGRLAGAILAESGTDFFLIGDTKRPCDWRAAGFEPPGEVGGKARPFTRLVPVGPVTMAGPWLALPIEGEPLARTLAARFLIERNGSVSDRLWRLVLGVDPEADGPPADAVVDAGWLGEVPPHIWNIVRQTVLKCL